MDYFPLFRKVFSIGRLSSHEYLSLNSGPTAAKLNSHLIPYDPENASIILMFHLNNYQHCQVSSLKLILQISYSNYFFVHYVEQFTFVMLSVFAGY